MWVARARYVMARDAERRQEQIVFGQLPEQTSAFIEADETCVFSWKVPGAEDSGEADRWHWVVYLGFVQRGSTDKLWIKEMKLRCSVGEPRIPQLGKAEYVAALEEAGFCSKTRAVLFTDSAPTFMSTGHQGIVDHHAVNHSEKEWSRSVEALHKPNQLRPALAHTQTIDRAWRTLKEDIPHNQSGKTEDGRELLQLHVRQQQWYFMMAGKDRWPAFCQAFHDMREHLREWPPEAPVPSGSRCDNVGPNVPDLPVPVNCEEGLLGAKAPEVPLAVHERMLALAADGALPVTSLLQRQRAVFSAGSTYGVPNFWAEARQFSYIHPNLPPPSNMKWAYKSDNTWTLEAKGG